MMKKILLLLLSLALGVSLLAGCEEESVQEEFDPISGYDGETVFKPEVSGEESGTAVAGGITVRDKKYAFERNNIVILNVENHTDENYVFTVTGTYLGADGEVLQTEPQSFDQLAAGIEHFFVFQPGIAFESFTYTVESVPTDEPMYIKNIEFVFSGLKEANWPVEELVDQGDHTFYPVILSMFGYINKAEDPNLRLKVLGTVVLLNQQDQVVAIYEMGSAVSPGPETDYYTKQLFHTTEGKLVWPEELEGEIRGIHATSRVYKPEQ